MSAIQPQEPLSGQTLLLEDDGDDAVANKAIKHSQSVFAKKQEKETASQPPQKRSAKKTAVSEEIIDAD